MLLAEEDNINRSVKVRGGIYTAKAKEGRFVFKNAPFGYRKQGERKERKLVVEESEAKIVWFIYESYLRNVPLYIIKKQARQLGFSTHGTTAIERVLSNPVYAGLLYVEAYKQYPGGLFPAIHEPIIDRTTWQLVQNKMKKPVKTRTVIDDEIPLRGLLKCHCGNPLSGAPSRGKSGQYFYYCKCRFSKHNNISAKKAHEQFLEACELMSIASSHLKKVKENCEKALDQELATSKTKIDEKKSKLHQIQTMLYSVEEKWIRNEITRDTYQRWYSSYNAEIISLGAGIDRLSKDQHQAFIILNKNLDLLTDLRYLYSTANTLQKREFVSQVFDNNLYYENGIYRTPTIMELLRIKRNSCGAT